MLNHGGTETRRVSTAEYAEHAEGTQKQRTRGVGYLNFCLSAELQNSHTLFVAEGKERTGFRVILRIPRLYNLCSCAGFLKFFLAEDLQISHTGVIPAGSCLLDAYGTYIVKM